MFLFSQTSYIVSSCLQLFFQIPYQQIGGEEQEKLVPLAFYCPSLLPPPEVEESRKGRKGRGKGTLWQAPFLPGLPEQKKDGPKKYSDIVAVVLYELWTQRVRKEESGG